MINTDINIRNKAIILFGDNVTMPYTAIGYHYESVDIRHRDAMPLMFDDQNDAIAHANNIIKIAEYYANKIKNNVNRAKAIDDAKHELEKITYTNKSIIIPLIYDLLYNVGKRQNEFGLYEYKYNLASAIYPKYACEDYESRQKKEEEEEKA